MPNYLARVDTRAHDPCAPALSKLRLFLFPLRSDRRFTGIAQRLRGLQCFQIPFEESCEVGMVLRSCERDSTLGRFDRFGKPPCLGVGGGENAKEHWVRRVGGLGEVL